MKCNKCGAKDLTDTSFYRKASTCKYCKIKETNKGNPKKLMLISRAEYERLINMNCTYCSKPKAGGVDRWNSDRPYTRANSLPACARCNCILKNDLSPAAWLAKCFQMYGTDWYMPYHYDPVSYDLLNPPLGYDIPPPAKKLKPLPMPTTIEDVNVLHT